MLTRTKVSRSADQLEHVHPADVAAKRLDRVVRRIYSWRIKSRILSGFYGAKPKEFACISRKMIKNWTISCCAVSFSPKSQATDPFLLIAGRL